MVSITSPSRLPSTENFLSPNKLVEKDELKEKSFQDSPLKPTILKINDSKSEDQIIEDLMKSPDVVDLFIEKQTVTPKLWKAICKCVKLEKLNLHSCISRSLSSEIEKLVNLKVLNLSGSTTKFLPPTLWDLKLEILNLSQTKIEHVAEEGFQKLQQLRELNLANSALTTLPSKGWSQLFQLETLDVSGLPIKELPLSTNIKIKNLDISKTQITSLDHLNLEKLEKLNVSRTKIVTIPRLPKIVELNIFACEHLYHPTIYEFQNNPTIKIIN